MIAEHQLTPPVGCCERNWPHSPRGEFGACPLGKFALATSGTRFAVTPTMRVTSSASGLAWNLDPVIDLRWGVGQPGPTDRLWEVVVARRPEVFVRALSMEEGRKLQRVTRTAKDPVKMRRAIVVLMSGQGQAVRDITSLLQVSPDYVRDVIHAFNERGFDALDPKWTLLANSNSLASAGGTQGSEV